MTSLKQANPADAPADVIKNNKIQSDKEQRLARALRQNLLRRKASAADTGKEDER